MLKTVVILTFTLLLNASDIRLQVLGSGGAELGEGASGGCILCIDGKSRLLIWPLL